eukprot:1161729-Pelagomonas_calceolata.AAC.11
MTKIATACACLYVQVTRILKVGNESTKLKATDVLLSIIQHDTPALRTFLLKQPNHMMFALLVRGACASCLLFCVLLADAITSPGKQGITKQERKEKVTYHSMMCHVLFASLHQCAFKRKKEIPSCHARDVVPDRDRCGAMQVSLVPCNGCGA